jgi:hypothetical protein
MAGRDWLYRLVRARYFKELLARGISTVPCSICRELVSLLLTGNHPYARSIQHDRPLSQGADPLDTSHWSVAHLSCNIEQKERPVVRRGAKGPSRDWAGRSQGAVEGLGRQEPSGG